VNFGSFGELVFGFETGGCGANGEGVLTSRAGVVDAG
jgi:hypothetical protein